MELGECVIWFHKKEKRTVIQVKEPSQWGHRRSKGLDHNGELLNASGDISTVYYFFFKLFKRYLSKYYILNPQLSWAIKWGLPLITYDVNCRIKYYLRWK